MKILESFPVVVDTWRDNADRSSTLISALHSGNLGDIIYSLPTCKLLGVNHFIINICADKGFTGRIMTEQSAKGLVPLLLAQPFIQRVSVVRSQVPWEYVRAADIGVQYVLDSFRLNLASPNLHLIYQHGLPFNLTVDGRTPWLTVPATTSTDPYAVVALTPRYRRYGREYYEKLLRNIPAEKIFFPGMEQDQIERMGISGNAYVASDHLQLAQLIAGASVFIGNPSFAYAIAEGLKVKRFVELPESYNVYPLDESGRTLHMYEPEIVRTEIFEALGLTGQRNAVLGTLRAELFNSQLNMNELGREVEQLQHQVNTFLASEIRLRHELHQLRSERIEGANVQELERLRASEKAATEEASRLHALLHHQRLMEGSFRYQISCMLRNLRNRSRLVAGIGRVLRVVPGMRGLYRSITVPRA